jgi:hypothetical protein
VQEAAEFTTAGIHSADRGCPRLLTGVRYFLPPEDLQLTYQLLRVGMQKRQPVRKELRTVVSEWRAKQAERGSKWEQASIPHIAHRLRGSHYSREGDSASVDVTARRLDAPEFRHQTDEIRGVERDATRDFTPSSPKDPLGCIQRRRLGPLEVVKHTFIRRSGKGFNFPGSLLHPGYPLLFPLRHLETDGFPQL